MRILINGFLIFLLWAIFCRYWYVCKIKHHCDEAPADIEMVATSVRAMDLGLYQGDSLILGGYEQLAFIGPGVQPELTASNELFLDSVAAWMNRHPESALTLTGSYRLSEEGNTSGFFENLGLARAAGLRQLLVDRGVAEDRIGLDFQALKEEDLSRPISFNLTGDTVVAGQDGQPATEAPAANAFTFTNMNFSGANFDRNSDVFRPNPTFEAYADSLKTYFQLHPDKSLTITGHTDALSGDAYNMELGRRRAQAVRRFLEQRGIKTNFKIASAGEREPVASNDTEEGRAKNRRVNLSIN